MSKRLCKLSRHQIADSLGTLHQIVGEANYVCRSCARASRDKQYLCKPVALAAPSPVFTNKVKDEEALTSVPSPIELSDSLVPDNLPYVGKKSSKKTLKKIKKAQRKQKKWQKKLNCVMKKQRKLVNRQKSLHEAFSQLDRLALSCGFKA